jgi:hypothetical protein
MIATIQFLLCAFVVVGCWGQRKLSNRFSNKNRFCPGDRITTIVGQCGLAVTMVGAFMGAGNATGWYDDKESAMVFGLFGFPECGITATQSIILFLTAGAGAIQARVLYSSWLKSRVRGA